MKLREFKKDDVIEVYKERLPEWWGVYQILSNEVLPDHLYFVEECYKLKPYLKYPCSELAKEEFKEKGLILLSLNTTCELRGDLGKRAVLNKYFKGK